MRLALLVAGVTACCLHTCGPAVAGEMLDASAVVVWARAPLSNDYAGLGVKSASAVASGARAPLSASDAVSVLCPGRGSLAPLFQAAAERYRIRPVVLVAMARVESSCDPRAVNRRTGAVGLLQILPTGSANVDGLSQVELLAPETSIDLGAKHLRKLVNLCGTLAGGLSVYHGNRKCSQHSGDGYVAKVLGLVTWAKRTIAKLQKVRS